MVYPSVWWRVVWHVRLTLKSSSQYSGGIPLYECTFSVLDHRIPFTTFEIEVLKNLVMTLSQLHPTRREYVNFNQCWCEYLEGNPYVAFFFHLFRCRRGPATQTWDKMLISLESTVRGFMSLHELQTFEDWFFMVNLIRPKDHATVCGIWDIVEGKCVELFPMYWNESHYLFSSVQGLSSRLLITISSSLPS